MAKKGLLLSDNPEETLGRLLHFCCQGGASFAKGAATKAALDWIKENAEGEEQFKR